MTHEHEQSEPIQSRLARDSSRLAFTALTMAVLTIGLGTSSLGDHLPIIEMLIGFTALSAMALCPPTAIVSGIIALIRISRSDGRIEGRREAWTGVILGAALCLLTAVAVPSFISARNDAQYNACICVLACADSAKEQWALESSRPAGSEVAREEIYPYIKNAEEHFICPKTKTDTYTVGALGVSPRCSYHGSLEESRQRYD